MATGNVPPLPPGFSLVGDAGAAPPSPWDTNAPLPSQDASVPPALPAGFQLLPAAQSGPEPPTTWERVSHGADNVASAVKQLYLMKTDPAASDDFTKQWNDQEKAYSDAIAAGAAQQQANPTIMQRTHDVLQSAFPLAALAMGLAGVDYQGADVPSIAGSMLAQAPLMFTPVPEAAAARYAVSGLQGLISGLVSNPTASGDAWGKLKQGGGGLALGGGIPMALENVAAPLVSALRDRVMGTTAPADVVAPDVLDRVAAAQSVGVVPSKAQLTRDPQDWYAEQELGKAEGPAKDAFVARGQANNAALADALANVAQNPTSGYDAAQSARQAIEDYETAARKGASATYDAAAAAPGADAPFPAQAFFDAATPHLQTYEDSIPGAVQKRLAELQAGLTPSAPARRVVAAVDSSKDDVITAIRKFGGINPDDEAVGSLAKANPFPPNPMYGPVWRQPAAYGSTGSNTAVGHSLDTMAQRLHTAGYIDEANPDLVMDKIADSTMSGPQYSAFFDQQAKQDPLASAIQQLTDQLGARNVAASTPTARDFTVGEASKLYQLINDTTGKAGGTAQFAGGQLKDALMTAGLAAPESSPAMQLFKDATQQYRTMKNTLGVGPTDALAGLTKAQVPTNYIETQIVNGNPGEIQQTMQLLRNTNPQSADAVHDATVGWLHNQAVNKNDVFSGTAYSKALDKLGPDRLNAIFGPNEVDKLNSLRTAGNAATMEPNMAAVNKSNTSSAVLNALKKTLGNEGVGAVMGESVGHFFGAPPIVGAGVGAVATKIANALAARSQARTMDAMLNPSMSDLIAGPTMAQQQRAAMAAALSRLNPGLTTSLVARATSATSGP